MLLYDKMREMRDAKGPNAGIIRAYMKMLLDGSAFSNWIHPPDSATRNKLVEILFFEGSGAVNLDTRKLQLAVKNEDLTALENEIEILSKQMLITEEEFEV